MEKKTKLKIKFYREVFTIFYLKSLNTVAFSSCLSDWYLTLISHFSCNVHATWVWYYWSTVQSIHVPALSLLKIANCIGIIIKSQHQLRYCLLNNASLCSVLIYKSHGFFLWWMLQQSPTVQLFLINWKATDTCFVQEYLWVIIV